ncbi:MAG TPA: hypothetical protein VGD99_25800 [Anaerolineae bacterium]|jgi:hypothetical protein
MKQSNPFVYVLFIVLLLGMSLTACRGTAGTPDTQATVDAAVAATANADQSVQATIAAAVEATGAAQAAVLADGASETASATPVVISQTIAITTVQTTTVDTTATETQDYTALSEEELVALIEQTVAQAAAATTQSSTVTSEATADDTVTPEEAQTVEVYVNTAEASVDAATAALDAYYELYYALAVETQAEIEELNQSLAAISESVDDMSESLAEIDETLSAGLVLAEDTITNLEETAQAAGDQANQLQQQAQTWQADYQAQVETRVRSALDTLPTQLVDSPQAALQDTFAFLQSGQQALADRQLTPNEVATVAQLGANASAGLAAQDQAQLQALSSSIMTITEQFTRGNISQAGVSLDQLNGSLGSISQLDFSTRPVERPAIDRPEVDRPAADRPERSTKRP